MSDKPSLHDIAAMPAFRERKIHRKSHERLMKILAERDGLPPVRCAVCRQEICSHTDLEFAGLSPVDEDKP